MRLWIFSDLHLNFARMTAPIAIPDADVCVVAGDVCVKGPDRSVKWLIEHVSPFMPVVFVAGNHEYYNTSLEGGLAAGRTAAAGSNVHFLENNALEINGVHFAGCTFWTDFELMGHRQFAMYHAELVMSDYQEVRLTSRSGRRMRASNTVRMHQESRTFIEGFLERHRCDRTVVVTHHAPSRRAISHHYASDLTSAAFASDLDALVVERGPDIWIHGHVHEPQSYMLGNTRILCNPRGYPDERSFRDFDFARVMEV
jgi:Icc-related predicted phosphoesterase